MFSNTHLYGRIKEKFMLPKLVNIKMIPDINDILHRKWKFVYVKKNILEISINVMQPIYRNHLGKNS